MSGLSVSKTSAAASNAICLANEGTLRPQELMLSQAFERFREASDKLEQRYTQLLLETEDLRRQLREKEETIRQSEKLATLGQMAAALAHEVRNPLGAMRLFTSLLRRDIADKPGALVLLTQTERSIESLDQVVSNMLHFAKDARPEKTACNLLVVVEEVLSFFRSAGHAQLEISLVAEGNFYLYANAGRLRQAIHNLVLNAAEAVTYKGKISLRLNGKEKNNLILEIEDSGAGIPEAMFARLFEPFQTSKNEGTGLGLAVVKAVCEEHAAQIEVTNKPGARFRLNFLRESK